MPVGLEAAGLLAAEPATRQGVMFPMPAYAEIAPIKGTGPSSGRKAWPLAPPFRSWPRFEPRLSARTDQQAWALDPVSTCIRSSAVATRAGFPSESSSPHLPLEAAPKIPGLRGC